MKTFYSFIFIFAISLQLFAGTSAKLEYPSFSANTRVRVVAANVMNYLSDFEASNASCKTQAAFDAKTDEMASVFVGLQADIVALCGVQQDDEILGYVADAMNKKIGKNVYDYVLDGSRYNNPAPGEYGNIKSGYIYRIDKLSEGVRYSTNPNDATFRLRMQVICFTEKSTKEKFVLSLNHFRAPSSDWDGSQRKAQATTLINALEINNYGDPDILIVGDLNAETTDDCLSPIVNAGYEEQLLKYDSQAYSYTYYGQRRLIDHAFANSSMAEQITGAYVYHLTSADNFTDHDVVVVGLNLGYKEPIKYTLELKCNSEQGSVTGPSTAEENEEVTISATAKIGYRFVRWLDGNTDNPRTMTVTQDTTLTAIFEYQLSGTCGQDLALTWTFDSITMALSIEGNGALTENYTYGPFIQSLTIGNNISVIGENAFAGSTDLQEVILGTSVKVLEANAFAGCTTIDAITCYSQRPPTVNSGALSGLPYSTVVFVPTSYLENYKMHDAWGLYDVRPMGLALNLVVNDNNFGIVLGAGVFAPDASATFSAQPNYGYKFSHWNDGNTQNPRTITVTQDTTFEAIFVPLKYNMRVTCDPACGYINGGNGKFDYLSQQTFEVVLSYGYKFSHWSDGNINNPRTITLTKDTSITAMFTKQTFIISLQSANEEQGTAVGVTYAEYQEKVTISAIPNYGYHFAQWSDGNTDNPRSVVVTGNTTYTAEFAIDKSGVCGANNCLTWSFSDDGTLIISGSGALTENYTYGLEAPTHIRTLVIGNEVTAIGNNAFYAKSTINHLVIGASVATIGDYAFAECRNFDDITCYAQMVPVITAKTFENVGNKQYIYLYVPEDRERAYKRDVYWGEFDVQVKGASTTTTSTDNVTVEPTDNTATLTWPTNDNAASYTIQITKDGVIVCTLIFNSNGQLTGLAFAPGRDGQSHAPAATLSSAGMSFTVTGLNSASKYAYELSVADENNHELVSYHGEFATTGYEGNVNPGGEPVVPGTVTKIDNVNPTTRFDGTTKFLRNGQLLIQRGDEIFNAQGARVR